MKIDRLRRVDFWAGVPICFLLTILRRILGRRDPIAAPVAPRRMLFIKLSELGSMVLAQPAVARARERWPEVEVFFLIFRDSREILDVVGAVDDPHVLVIDQRGPVSFLISTLRVVLRARRLGIDTTIDLELFARCTVLLAVAVGARHRVGFDRYRGEGLYRGDLLTHGVAYNPHLHTARAFLALVEALDHDPRDAPLVKIDLRSRPLAFPRFAAAAESRGAVVRQIEGLAGAPLAGRKVFLLNPNASELIPIRRWPIERYVELARRLLEDPHHLVVTIGQNVDAEHARRLAAEVRSDRLVDLTSRTSLPELLTLFTLATALVTNDSGPAHFASLTDLPTVTLFGPETPVLYGPLGERQRNLYAGLACSPCVSVWNHRSTPCRHAQCLHDIGVDAVMGTLRELGVLA